MQQGKALPDVGRPVELFRNTADVIQESRAHFEGVSATGLTGGGGCSTRVCDRTHSAETIGTMYSLTPAVKPLVLLAGERGFTSLLKYIVENNGFNCILTEDLAEAITLAEIERPDLIALDDMLPAGSALAVRQKIYQNLSTRHIPVLILADGSIRPEASIMSFAEGTHYILKPFLPDAFISRLHDVARQSPSAVSTNVLRFADIIMERDAHRVYRSQRCIHLCPVEYRVLQQLLEYPRKVFSREQILATVRAHSDHAAARSVDVHISRIRKALCEHGEPNYIRTVRGLGYSLDAAPEGPATYITRPRLIHAVG
jgi:two-component system phosphate regulon response regulator PhoB